MRYKIRAFEIPMFRSGDDAEPCRRFRTRGYHHPTAGLLVHRALDATTGAPIRGEWSVTHAESGRRIRTYKTRAAAVDAMWELAEFGDWHRSATEISRDKALTERIARWIAGDVTHKPRSALVDEESREPIPGMAKEIMRHAFRGFVGMAMFCAFSKCRAVLDCRSAVELETLPQKAKNGESVDGGSTFLCPRCYANWLRAINAKPDAADVVARYKVTEGSELYS